MGTTPCLVTLASGNSYDICWVTWYNYENQITHLRLFCKPSNRLHLLAYNKALSITSGRKPTYRTQKILEMHLGSSCLILNSIVNNNYEFKASRQKCFNWFSMLSMYYKMVSTKERFKFRSCSKRFFLETTCSLISKGTQSETPLR